jgi:hypothetical protein
MCGRAPASVKQSEQSKVFLLLFFQKKKNLLFLKKKKQKDFYFLAPTAPVWPPLAHHARNRNRPN